MIKSIENKMMQMNGTAVKYVEVQSLKKTTNKIIKQINKQIQRDFGLAGPLTLSTPSQKVHAIRWVVARESYIVETNVKRLNKEIVAACISQINKCPYCEDAHGTSIISTGNNLIANSIINGTWKNLKDEKIKNLINWSLNTLKPNSRIIKNPPFSKHEAAEIIGTALVFHSTNRLVSIFLEESPLPAIFSGNFMKKTALKIASKTLFKTMVSKSPIAGEGLKFIPISKVTSNLEWSKNIPPFSKALATEQELLNTIEKELPIEVIDIFKEKVNSWNGEEMPIGRSWLNNITKNFNSIDKPIANILFLSAFAPYTITSDDINSFQQVKSSDKELIESCFWAIQVLTNRIGEWLITPFNN